MFHFPLPITDPTRIFFVVLSVILCAPMILERLRIPSIIGMITAGIVIGPHGLHLLERDSSFAIFGKVGLLYIMFLAALEMNIQDVRKQRDKALAYGLISFGIPMCLGVAMNHWLLGYILPASVLMAAMYASHTLITYPTVMRLGISKHRAVNIAVGGTMVAVTLTLFLLAVVGGLYKEGSQGWSGLALLLLKVGGLALIIVLTFPYIARRFFRRYGDSVLQYIFIMSLVFLGSGMMEIVGMEGILGAFLVGLVLNREIPPGGPLMSHLEFVGNALFIPYFLIGVGMLISISAFTDLGVLTVAAVMILCGTGGKLLGAWVFQQIFRLSASERRLMFGLSSARAAATLAIVLVGYEIILPDGSRLLGDEVLNAAMFLILASCIISSVATDHAARSIALAGEMEAATPPNEANDNIMLALRNPKNVVALAQMALMLRTPNRGSLTAVSVILDDDPDSRAKGQKNLDFAAKTCAAANVRMQTHCRWSVNPVTGISYAAREHEATDILIGLHQKEKITDLFFGRFTEDLVTSVLQQVIIYRSVVPIYTIRRIHIVAPSRGQHDPGFREWVDRMGIMAQQICARVSVYSRPGTLEAIKKFWTEGKYPVEAEYIEYNSWHDFTSIAHRMRSDHLIAFILAQKGTPWRHNYHNHVPEQLERHFSARSIMVIVPARVGAGSSSSAEFRAGIALEQK